MIDTLKNSNNTPKREEKPEKKRLHLINEDITVSPVMLVGQEDEKNQVMEVSEALKLAKEKELDLVLINQKNTPPIVKILDYGKLLYEIKKQKSKNKQTFKVKSITVKPQISSHDIGWKADKAIECLKSGSNVQFFIRATGRMSNRIDIINEVYENFSNLIKDHGKSKDGLKKINKIQYSAYFNPVKTNK